MFIEELTKIEAGKNNGLDEIPFIPGNLYKRVSDIHEVFGGQRQGGISTPKNHKYVFVFTGSSGLQYGYEDGWTDDGVFVYTGEGQKGDMEFKGGNKAIRDHSENGKELLMFEALGKGKPVKFVGVFACASYEHVRGLDLDGNDRQAIVFHLTPANVVADSGAVKVVVAGTLEDLRKAALSAASQGVTKTSRKGAAKTYYQRCEAVRSYVLARADGVCECCGSETQFIRKSGGSPYLEAHHILRVADNGPDHPNSVAAICANCHREIHHGQEGAKINEKLRTKIMALEGGQIELLRLSEYFICSTSNLHPNCQKENDEIIEGVLRGRGLFLT